MLTLGALANILEDFGNLVLEQGFLLEQGERQAVQNIAVFQQNLERLIVCLLQQGADLSVNLCRGRVGVVACRSAAATEERFGVFAAELHGTNHSAHAVVGNHLAGGVGCLLNVVRRTGGRVVEDDFLSRTATHRVRHLVKQFMAGRGVLIVLRHDHGVTQGATTRKNRNLGDGRGVTQCRRDQGVTALVVCGDLTLVLVHDARGTLRTSHDAVDCLVDSAVVNHVAVIAGGQQSRLVHDVRQVSTGEAGGALSNLSKVNGVSNRLACGVNAQDVFAALHVGGVHTNLTVKTAGTQQRRVQNVGSVRCSNDDDVRVAVEAVHLNQQLVQGLLTLVITAAHADAAAAANSVNLVDEDDGGGVALRFLEQVAHAGRTHTHEHFNEVRARNRVERHASLARHSLGEQGLTGAGRAVQQNALGDLCTQAGELFGFSQELADFFQFGERLVHAGNVAEAHIRLVLGELLRAGLGEAHDGGAASDSSHQEPEERTKDQNRQEQGHQGAQEAVLNRLVRVAFQLGGFHCLSNFVAAGLHVVEAHRLTVVVVALLVVVLKLQLDALVAVVDLCALDLVVVEQLKTHVGVHLTRGLGEEGGHEESQHDYESCTRPEPGAVNQLLQEALRAFLRSIGGLRQCFVLTLRL